MSHPQSAVPDNPASGASGSIQNKTEVLAPSTNPNLDSSASTSAHPGGPDPTTGSSAPPSFAAHRRASDKNGAGKDHAAEAGLPAAGPAPAAQLPDLKVKLQSGLRQFPNFPQPGVLFEDIMPLFANPEMHETLIQALELLVGSAFGGKGGVGCVVGLESRGFLFGPSLALR